MALNGVLSMVSKELLKSIDTEIFELLPIEEPELPETVLKVIYDAALEDIRLRWGQMMRLWLNLTINEDWATITSVT